MYLVAKVRWCYANGFFEYRNKITRIFEPDSIAYFKNKHLALNQKFFGMFHADIQKVSRYTHMTLLIKMLG